MGISLSKECIWQAIMPNLGAMVTVHNLKVQLPLPALCGSNTCSLHSPDIGSQRVRVAGYHFWIYNSSRKELWDKATNEEKSFVQVCSYYSIFNFT